MTWWERAYLFEIVRGLSITGGVFLVNMWRWISGRKGALTTYYPEETRADYAAHNRGKHILTQRPDGGPQCIACNLCATVCPALVHRDRRRLRPGRCGPPQVPGALRDRLFALHLLRAVRGGLPGGRDPHGQGSARTACRTTAATCGSRRTSCSTGTRSATSRSPTPPASVGRPEARHDRRPARSARQPCSWSSSRAARSSAGCSCSCCASRCGSRSRSSRPWCSSAAIYGLLGVHYHRRLPGADLRRRGDGVHGLRDHAPRRARPVVHPSLLAAARARHRRRARAPRRARARRVAGAPGAFPGAGRMRPSARSSSPPSS